MVGLGLVVVPYPTTLPNLAYPTHGYKSVLERNVLVLVTSATNRVIRVWESICRDVFRTERPELPVRQIVIQHENYVIDYHSKRLSANQSNDCDCASGTGSNLDKKDDWKLATNQNERKQTDR